MSNTQALASYYVIITLGYLWAFVQLCAGEPFDALVLLVVTVSFHSYRNAVKREVDHE